MMSRRIIVLTVLCMLALALTPAWAQGRPTRSQGPPASGGGSGPTVGQAIHHDTSMPLRDMVIRAPRFTGLSKEVPIMVKPDLGRDPSRAEPDGGIQSDYEYFFELTPAPIVSAPGLSEQDNVNTVGFAVVPPDTNGDIGLDASGNRIYVQYINLIWAVRSPVTLSGRASAVPARPTTTATRSCSTTTRPAAGSSASFRSARAPSAWRSRRLATRWAPIIATPSL